MTKIILEIVDQDRKEYDLDKYRDDGKDIFFITVDGSKYNVSRFYPDELLSLWFKEDGDWYNIGYVEKIMIEV